MLKNFFVARPFFRTKICRPSRFSPKKLSPVLKTPKIITRHALLQNWSRVLFFTRPYARPYFCSIIEKSRMLVDFYIRTLSNDMKIAVQKNHLGANFFQRPVLLDVRNCILPEYHLTFGLIGN